MRSLALFGVALLGTAFAAQQTTVTVLATTDIHGYLYPMDYLTGAPAPRGLASIATLIEEQRAQAPDALLVDAGDTIQGSPLEYVYQTIVRTGRAPLGLSFRAEQFTADPMMLAMNYLRYDAMALGNHEFNYGLENLARARRDAQFPWLSANTVVAPGSAARPFDPYIVKTLRGVKVAVIGVTTPAVPAWEKPENYAGYQFLPARQAVAAAVEKLRRKERPDLILVAAHMGLERDPKTGAVRGGEENQVYDLATRVEGLDAIVFGHTHRQLEKYEVGKVLLVQPKNWAMSLARIDFTLERSAGGKWEIAGKVSRLVPVTAATQPDEEVMRIGRPYEKLAERYLNTPVATSGSALDATLCRVEDTAILDAVQAVQLEYAQAEVSLSACFNPRVKVPPGPVTVRQIAALYPYDNELYAVEVTGRVLKQALENAARYFQSCAGAECGNGPLTNPRVMPFNFDVAQGVEYEIDLTRPEGSRIRNLWLDGRPLEPDRKVRLAINNYRLGGSGGYGMLAGAKVLWRSGDDIRDLIIRYYTQRGTLPARADGNWRILPVQAVRVLEDQARADARRLHLQ